MVLIYINDKKDYDSQTIISVLSFQVETDF